MTNRETFLNENWDYRVVLEAYEVVSTLNSMERETNGHRSAQIINKFKTNPKLQIKRDLINVFNFFSYLMVPHSS